MGRRRSSKRSTVNCLFSCLKHKVFPHVLKWTDNEREFSILFRRKGSSNWDSSDLDFFKAMDGLSPSKKVKYSNQPDYDLGCKRRCKANLRKLCNDKILKYIGKKEIQNDKSTKLKYYKFLEIPKENEKIAYRPFVITKDRELNENINVANNRAKRNVDVARLLDLEKNEYFMNSNTSDAFENPEMEIRNEHFMNSNTSDAFEIPEMEIRNVKEYFMNSNTSDAFENPEMEIRNENDVINSNISEFYELPKMELSNVKENDDINSNISDIYELPKRELSNVKELFQIKASLPGYNEWPKSSLTQQRTPLWSNYTPQIKNGMNIDELADNL